MGKEEDQLKQKLEKISATKATYHNKQTAISNSQTYMLSLGKKIVNQAGQEIYDPTSIRKSIF